MHVNPFKSFAREPRRWKFFGRSLIFFALFVPAPAHAEEPTIEVGAAKVDITPEYPVRLSGYGGRREESEGIDQRIWAKALAFGSDREGASVLLTVDNVGVPAHITEAVYAGVAGKVSLRRENFALASSHTHTAPMLRGALPFLFAEDIPAEHQERIDRYTGELIEQLQEVALAALADRRPALLSWGEGSASFARNRRGADGRPVDHALPLLAVHSPAGDLHAVLVNYACHCTTLEHNKIHGDWAGSAQELIEEEHPGSIALISIGAGADANPEPRGDLSHARRHGREIADEVSRLLSGALSRISRGPSGKMQALELPFAHPPTREELEAKSIQDGIVGYHARKNLERLDKGEALPSSLPYEVQAWHFGDELAMVFLPGEVVVDYALRLKADFDRLWVTAYANDVPCYIPSERVLARADAEYHYEAAFAMHYYDRPTKFAPGLEKLIVEAVHAIVPKSFLSDGGRERGKAVPAWESLEFLNTPPGLTVELAVSEPMIVDPVAIDFGPDGKLWVVEMHDYPMGIDGNWKPGGRVKFLEDSDGDGSYDKATLFLDELPFPTGVMAWRKGALICAAPDILYAEDTTGDGRADRIQKIFTGFATENYQARVNGLSYGLDNWIYGANGLLGGTISGMFGDKEIDIRGRDFRMNLDTGEFEPVAGLTQQGRVRDDWGNWFGSDNSTVGWHYPLPEHYLRRNPHIESPGQRVPIGTGADPHRVYPSSETAERFNQPNHANRVTSACGETIYRDNLLGEEFYGNYFITESVHNLVHRLDLKLSGVTIRGHRVPGDEQSEFFSSSDNWSRPVQVRTGPDGALWVVDMYRAVIEHPRWISDVQLAKLDVRAGEKQGRIYRIYPKNAQLRPIPNFTRMSAPELVLALDTPNGPQRDLIQMQLVERRDKSVADSLANLARESEWPAVRVQALATLDGLGALKPEWLIDAASDEHPGVRRHAIRLSEPFFSESEELARMLLSLVEDDDAMVRYQLALSLGEWNDRRAGAALGDLVLKGMDDPWMRTAILSSSIVYPGEVLAKITNAASETPGREELIGGLISTVVALDDPGALTQAVSAVTSSDEGTVKSWQVTALADLVHALEKRGMSLDGLAKETDSAGRLTAIAAEARILAFNTEASVDERAAGLRLLGARGAMPADDLPKVVELIDSPRPELAEAALEAARRQASPRVAELLLSDWKRRAPSLRALLIDILLSRDGWSLSLLKAIEGQVVSGAEISATNQERLLGSGNEEVRRRARSILEEFRPRGREEVLAAYREVDQLVSRAPAGARVFQTSCAACHSFRGEGQAFGPDVGLFQNKSVSEFVEAILDPNAVIEPRFIHYLVETRDGRRLAGVIAEETANSLTLVQMGGARENLFRSDIVSINASNRSMMPEGLEANITPQEMADLIAYLRSDEPQPFGSASAESAQAARKNFYDAGVNGISKVITAAEVLEYPSWLGPLPMPHCRQTNGESRLVWKTDPVPADLPTDAEHVFRLPVGMGHFAGQPAGGFDLKVNGRSMLGFDVVLDHHVWESSDGLVRMFYEVRERNHADSNGTLTIEVAGALLEAGKPALFEVVGVAADSLRWFGIYLLADDLWDMEAGKDDGPLGQQILDDAKPRSVREAIIGDHPERSAEILQELISGLVPGTDEEYRRIPWIWRVTIAAGRRNDTAELRRLLEISTPKLDAPLRHWEAVVLGGGLINGITQAGTWPGARIEEVIGDDEALQRRWTRALNLSAAMADDESVPSGTRYDALRMIALQPWERHGEQLLRYLGPKVAPELQQGAVSGLGDMRSPRATQALIDNLKNLTDSNRNFAIEALVRTPERTEALLQAVEEGAVARELLGEEWITRLVQLDGPELRRRAKRLLADEQQ